VPTCLRCRREVPDDAGDELALSLDGRPMLEALSGVDRESLDEAQRAMLDCLVAGICPVCGQAL
jgi:hypothetical protein